MKAYEVGFSGRAELEAPYVLEPYTIEILNYAQSTSVIFLQNTAPKLVVVKVRGTQATLEKAVPETLEVKPVLLPGVLAGEIVAVYAEALKQADSVVMSGPGTFDALLDLWPSSSLVSFVPHQLPKRDLVGTCIAGNCNGRTVYRINLRQGKVTISIGF
jgi:hypothetical protein